MAQTLHNLALFYRNSGQLDKAAAPYERSRGIWRAKEAWGLLAVSFKDSAVLCDLQVVKRKANPQRALHTRVPCAGRAARARHGRRRWVRGHRGRRQGRPAEGLRMLERAEHAIENLPAEIHAQVTLQVERPARPAGQPLY